MVLRSDINQPGPEALNQIISKRGRLPRLDPLNANSSRAQLSSKCRKAGEREGIARNTSYQFLYDVALATEGRNNARSTKHRQVARDL